VIRARKTPLRATVAVVAVGLLTGCSAQTIVELLPVSRDAPAQPTGAGAQDASTRTPMPERSDAADDYLPKSSASDPSDAAAHGAASPSAPATTDAAGTLPGPCSSAVRTGPTVSALNFGGSGARVEIANSSRLNLATDFALEAWVLLCSTGGGPVILSQYVRAQEDKYVGLEPVNHAPVSWFLVLDDMPTVVSSVPLSLGTWHHVAVSAGSRALRLFVDGQWMATTLLEGPVSNGSGTLYIGGSARPGRTAAIDGYIADVRVSSYNRYAANFTPPTAVAVDSATVALWPLDEGAGTVATDRGAARLNGLIVGGASWVQAPARR
jgi:hypothetical protein